MLPKGWLALKAETHDYETTFPMRLCAPPAQVFPLMKPNMAEYLHISFHHICWNLTDPPVS